MNRTIIFSKRTGGRTPGERATYPEAQADWLVASGHARYTDQPEPEGPPWWTPRTDPLAEGNSDSDNERDETTTRRNKSRANSSAKPRP